MMPRAIVIDTYGQTRPLFCFSSMRSGHFWPAACWCIRTGTEFGTLAAVPLWFVLWRGSALSPAITGLGSGLFLGFAGMTVLEIYCPIRDAWHILFAHIGVLVILCAVGLLVGAAVEKLYVRGLRP
jgi:hypothetical protein